METHGEHCLLCVLLCLSRSLLADPTVVQEAFSSSEPYTDLTDGITIEEQVDSTAGNTIYPRISGSQWGSLPGYICDNGDNTLTPNILWFSIFCII